MSLTGNLGEYQNEITSLSAVKLGNYENIFNFNLLDVNKSILKLNSTSHLLKGNPNNNEINKRISKVYNHDNSNIGIGLYKEKRKIYKGTNFVSELNVNERLNISIPK